MPFQSRSILLLVVATTASAQQPFRHFSESVESRFARSDPVVSYTIRVDSADLSGFDVELRLRNASDTVRLAMAHHPEYDDRFFRYVESVRAEGPRGATITHVDSAMWLLVARGGESVVRYRIHLPPSPSPRAAWRPFLAPTGGLIGGPHSYIYVVGKELAPAHVHLELPPSWTIATAMRPTSDPKTFFAATIHVLVESPVLAGRLHDWQFTIDGVPHRVAYWALPNATAFDTTAFVNGVQGIARQAIAVFGRAPWPEYDFLFQDGAYGALEHPSSVTLGAPSATLAEGPRGMADVLGETAHEFFHAWNLMRIRPTEYQGVDHRPPMLSGGLWFSEGLSMYYADLLIRRAGLPRTDSTRIAHLEGLIARYLSNPAYGHFSTEAISRAAYATRPDALGDYEGGVHLAGELLGTMLDFVIRDATSGRRSLDDLMRTMLERYGGERGFTSTDVERAVHDVCTCDVHAFFGTYVRGSTPIDFARYLRLAGLRLDTRQIPSVRDSQPLPDMRIRAWMQPSDSTLRLLVFSPTTVWGRAGLHTGDRLLAANGTPMTTAAEFRTFIGRLRIGDSARIDVQRSSGRKSVAVVVTGFDRATAHIVPDANASEKQRRIREAWLRGD
jgi:predicted metalloprotease with PDZ domain